MPTTQPETFFEPVFGSQRDFATVFRDEEAFLAALIKQYPLE